jgi:RHS repeat-associated protein
MFTTASAPLSPELDDNNNLTTSRQYDVYGAPRAGTQQGVAATSSQGYAGSLGHVTDASTGGLIYMQARYYDPGSGRSESEDSGGHGVNWFIYCADQPTDRLDPTGKDDGDLGSTLEAAGEEFGLDSSADGLGLQELEGFIGEQPNQYGQMVVYIRQITSYGQGMFNKVLFLNLINQIAQDGGFTGVNISGQCLPGSMGSNMLVAMSTILGQLGDSGQLSADDDATQLYWELQN